MKCKITMSEEGCDPYEATDEMGSIGSGSRSGEHEKRGVGVGGHFNCYGSEMKGGV